MGRGENRLRQLPTHSQTLARSCNKVDSGRESNLVRRRLHIGYFALVDINSAHFRSGSPAPE